MFPALQSEVKEDTCYDVSWADSVLLLERNKIGIGGVGIGLLVEEIAPLDSELPTAFEAVGQRHVAKEHVFACVVGHLIVVILTTKGKIEQLGEVDISSEALYKRVSGVANACVLASHLVAGMGNIVAEIGNV